MASAAYTSPSSGEEVQTCASASAQLSQSPYSPRHFPARPRPTSRAGTMAPRGVSRQTRSATRYAISSNKEPPMRTPALLFAAALSVAPTVAFAQATTQSRTGLGNGDHPTTPTDSTPAGSENATTGPQSRPAYPSGSTTPNPGAAQVQTMPTPATGPTGVAPASPGAATATQEGAAAPSPGGK
jgi:hypothetical protein